MKRFIPWLLLACAACGEDPRDFALRFAAISKGAEVGCGSAITGLGTASNASIQLADLRFYVSNMTLLDEDDKPIDLNIIINEFQYNALEGHVALIDLTATSDGACGTGAIAFAEGTSRVNDVFTAHAKVDGVRKLSFDVGVPQALMRKVIAASSEEGAPQPLREMYWSWATGYRHLVMNAAVDTPGGHGEGYVHVGSRDCGSAGQKALTDRDTCGFVNTPHVELAVDGLANRVVELDVDALLADVDFVVPIVDQAMNVIGEGPGVACHSGPAQADCAPVFASLGMDVTTGSSDASAQQVFSVR